MRTITYFQWRFDYTHHLYYGPIKLPDLNFFKTRLINEDDRGYIDNLSNVWPFKEINRDEFFPRLEDIFSRNRSIFLSGRGMVSHYILLSKHRVRIIKKPVPGNMISSFYANGKTIFVTPLTVQAAKMQVKLELRNNLYKFGNHQIYKPTNIEPDKALDIILRGGRNHPCVDSKLMLAFLIYQERKKKKLL